MRDQESSDEVVSTTGLKGINLESSDQIASEESIEENIGVTDSQQNDGNDTDASTEIESQNGDGDSDGVGLDSNGAEMLLIEAVTLKDEGNNHFKSDKLNEAAQAYRSGVNKIKKLNKQNTGNDQVKALLVNLMTNLSLVYYKQSKFQSSVELAGKALTIEQNNVKALYRRALALRKVGDLDRARVDLRTALQFDPNNASCKKELASVKKEVEQLREIQKRALSKAFSNKTGSFLYEDKELEDKRKEEEAAQKKREDQRLLEKRKAEWEDECVKRLANNQEVDSFEDWEKKRKKEEERKKKESEKKRQEEIRRKSASRQTRRAPAEDSDSDSDNLTEKELAMMRGYKKTSDGRTTSYFTREISEQEKQHFENVAPQRIIESPDNAPSRIDRCSQSAPSAWNQAKTWEEKDCTEWCKNQLRLRLSETFVSDEKLECRISSVDELNGDAAVAMAGGKKRYIFDFHVKMTYETKDTESNAVTTAKVRIPDISSALHEELDVVFEDSNNPLRSTLVNKIRSQVQAWVNDFNVQY